MYIVPGKGISPIRPQRDKQFEYYLLYFICSDDKIKRVKPYLLYGGKFLVGLGNGLAHVNVLKCVFVGFEYD